MLAAVAALGLSAAPAAAQQRLVAAAYGKRHGPVVAVDGVAAAAAARGEFLGLLGPSGRGKTTTLQVIAGFETPAGGRVVLDGQDLSAVPLARHGVSGWCSDPTPCCRT